MWDINPINKQTENGGFALISITEVPSGYYRDVCVFSLRLNTEQFCCLVKHISCSDHVDFTLSHANKGISALQLILLISFWFLGSLDMKIAVLCTNKPLEKGHVD